MKLTDRLQKGAATDPRLARPTPASSGPVSGPAAAPTVSSALAGFKASVHQGLVARLGNRLYDTSISPEQLNGYVAQEISDLMQSTGVPLSLIERQQLTSEILDDVMGLGPIEKLLADPTVSEIMVNSLSYIDESSPMVDARLVDGSRVNAIIPPLAVDGPVLTIRKFSADPLTIDNLIEFQTVTPEVAALLKAVVELGLNIIISGGTETMSMPASAAASSIFSRHSLQVSTRSAGMSP